MPDDGSRSVPPALAELHDAAAFYAAKVHVELGLAFVAEFERTANLILENPLIGTIFRDTRKISNHCQLLIEMQEVSMIWLESQASHPL